MYIYIYSAVLKRLTTPSDVHAPLPSIVPFACPEISFTHSSIYNPSSHVLRGRPRFCRHSGFQLTLTLLTWTIWRAPTNASKWRMGFNSVFKGVNHDFWQSCWVLSLNMPLPNKLFSSYIIHYRILGVRFSSNIFISFYI